MSKANVFERKCSFDVEEMVSEETNEERVRWSGTTKEERKRWSGKTKKQERDVRERTRGKPD